MIKEQFDDIIKDKMESMSPPLGEDTWSIFEKVLDADAELHLDTDDESFDKTIKEKLISNHHVSPNTQWQTLKDKLTNIQKRRDSVFLSKTMELVAILLLIITFHNYGGYLLPDQDGQTPHNKVEFAAITDDVKSIKHSDKTSQIVSIDNTNTLSKVPTSRNKTNKTVQSTKTISSTDASQIALTNQDISTNLEINFANVDTYQNEINPIEEVGENSDVLSENHLNTAFVTPITEMADSAPNQEVGELNIDLIPVNIEPVYTEMASIFPLQISSPKGKTVKAISVFASADVNLINTPFDKLYSIPSYTKEALNNAYGMRISTQKNNLEVESGLDYSRREYQPALFNEAFGNTSDVYFVTSLDKITFDIASIPINLKYHFINKKGWGSYLMLGAAFNVIVNAAYEIPTVLVEGRPSPDRYTPVRPRLEEKEFTKGLFNGDALKDNYFATAGFGLGIEKKIFDNTSIYVQSSYHRHLLTPGIGPKNDKIHTSSLQFGVKTILN